MYHLIKDVDVMELANEVYDSINNYFSVLTHIGYKPYSDVYKLLLFSFIEELLYGPMSQYVTDDDYRAINEAIYCLYGSCMISFPDYKRSFDSVINRMPDKYRITETGVLRETEDYELRVKS